MSQDRAGNRHYHPDRPYRIYRYFDADTVLLYIGISRDVDRRLSEQKANDWRRYVRTMRVGDSFPTWSEAIESERSAVQVEHPLFNGTWSDEETILRSAAYMSDRGHDASRYQRRLAAVYFGSRFLDDSELRQFVDAYQRGERPGVQRIA